MRVAIRAIAVLTVALALGGCTAGSTSSSPKPRPPTVVVAGEAGSDVGNDRPKVTYDGLMVRRRVVIAVHTAPDTDLASLRKQLDLVATRRHTTLSTISASVLDPVVLERLAPDLVVALPAGATLAEAGKLIDPTFVPGRRFTDQVQEYDVASVLVHDLRFTVGAAHPAVLARAIAREGILSDALGNYTTTVGTRELDIAYTGPLLSDHSVESVRNGIARRADITPGVVTVSPRSTTGVGVDMAREPVPPPVVIQASTGHHHGAALPTTGRSSRLDPWTIAALALIALLSLTLVLLMTKRFDRPEQRSTGTAD
jgi:hypothetical protein